MALLKPAHQRGRGAHQQEGREAKVLRCLSPVSSPLTGSSTHCTHKPEGCALALASGSSLPQRMRWERSKCCLPSCSHLSCHSSPPCLLWDPVPLLPLGCWPWKQAHSPQTPVALWLSSLGHLCAPVPGDSEHWDLVPAHSIQVIIQGQQDLRRKMQARFRSCWPGRSSFQIVRPCFYRRYSQIYDSGHSSSPSASPQKLCDPQPQREFKARRHWERNKGKERA